MVHVLDSECSKPVTSGFLLQSAAIQPKHHQPFREANEAFIHFPPARLPLGGPPLFCLPAAIRQFASCEWGCLELQVGTGRPLWHRQRQARGLPECLALSLCRGQQARRSPEHPVGAEQVGRALRFPLVGPWPFKCVCVILPVAVPTPHTGGCLGTEASAPSHSNT